MPPQVNLFSHRAVAEYRKDVIPRTKNNGPFREIEVGKAESIFFSGFGCAPKKTDVREATDSTSSGRPEGSLRHGRTPPKTRRMLLKSLAAGGSMPPAGDVERGRSLRCISPSACYVGRKSLLRAIWGSL